MPASKVHFNGGVNLAEAESVMRAIATRVADGVRRIMIFLLMAAHDTVTITLSTMMYELARHPAWQERLREEAISFGPGSPGFDDLATFASLDLVMRESMRLVAPVPALPRRTARDTRGARLLHSSRCPRQRESELDAPVGRLLVRTRPLRSRAVLRRAARPGRISTPRPSAARP